MPQRPLTKKLLSIIIAVQDYAKYHRSHNIMLRNNNIQETSYWFEETRDYYFGLPTKILKNAKLKPSTDDFEYVLSFKVTPEMLKIEFKNS
ncbi:MAG: hypothetical protein WC725_04955 [Patescibacteria group bacterium]|jgi:hypothetical protein